MPKVTVQISTYNRQHLLGQAIQSVIYQTYSDFELIVVDDGSTDSTSEVLNQFSDPRIRYVYQDNRGLSAARNTGLRLAMGEFICFLDDDDCFLPNKLETQVKALENDATIGLVASGYFKVHENGCAIEEIRSWEHYPVLDLNTLLFYCPFLTHAVLIRRSLLEQIGGFDENLIIIEDWDCWLRLAYAGCKMSWVKDIVCSYHFHSNQMTKRTKEVLTGRIAIFEKFFSQDDLPDELVSIKHNVISHIYLLNASRAYASGWNNIAKNNLQSAINLKPNLPIDEQDYLVDVLLGEAKPLLQTGGLSEHAKTIANNLPDSIQNNSRFNKHLISDAALITSFESYKKKDWNMVRRSLPIAIRNNPNLLLNRGIWSIALQSFMNK